MKELTCDVQGKKTLPVTDNGLLSVDLKGGYNFNPRSRKVGDLLVNLCACYFLQDLKSFLGLLL